MRFHGTDPESIRRRLDEIAAAERYDRREFWLALALVSLWPVLALGLIAAGLHDWDPRVGQLCLAAGAMLGTVGPLGSLVWLHHRAE
jgi:hypothetical protein